MNNTDLSYANFNGVDLNGANFTNADLSYASLINANLNGANFTNAKVKNARFGGDMGLTEDMKLDLKRRGAIFEDSPGEHSRVLVN